MAHEPDRAVFLGLVALYETTSLLDQGPLVGTLTLRALLALLHARSSGEAAPYADFWRRCIWPGAGQGSDGYVRSTYARTHWSQIVRTLGLEPAAMELHAGMSGILARQRDLHQPEWKARFAVVEMLKDAKHNREIVSSKGHPFTARGREVMEQNIAQGHDPDGTLR